MRALDLKIISQRMVEKKWQPFAAPAPGWLVDKALWGAPSRGSTRYTYKYH